ncbi:MAG: DUF4249 domain-containing protein [Bacteroidales bacterium]|nr:DUF4249 domain-containing protein [Bacteroidales bacterium]
MRKIQRISFGTVLMGLVLGMAACTDEIDIDLKGGDAPILVVDARLTTDTIRHTVLLSRSSDYYAPTSADLAVSGATVYITDGERRFDFAEDPASPGVFLSLDTFAGQMGVHYALFIDDVDADRDGKTESYTAESTMPFTNDIDSLQAVYGPAMPPAIVLDPERMGWNILFYAQDLPQKDYYLSTISVNGVPLYPALTEMTRLSDDFTQGLYIGGLQIYFFADDGEMPLSVGDSVCVEIWNATHDFDEYISDLQNALAPSMPMFGGSPANARGNLSGGAFGFFATYTVRRASVVLK